MTNPVLRFRSTLFEIEPGEDSETNPLCYGRQFSRWLREHLIAQGVAVEEVIPEDWGWCLMVQRKPFLLWVGCVAVHDYATTHPTDPVPSGKDVIWACTVFAKQSIFARLFNSADTTLDSDSLFAKVKEIIAADPANTIMEVQ